MPRHRITSGEGERQKLASIKFESDWRHSEWHGKSASAGRDDEVGEKKKIVIFRSSKDGRVVINFYVFDNDYLILIKLFPLFSSSSD